MALNDSHKSLGSRGAATRLRGNDDGLIQRCPNPVVTGIGVASALGYGKQAFLDGMFAPMPSEVFGELRRPGRQYPDPDMPFIGAEMPEPPDLLPKRVSRTASLTGRVAVAVLDEAWREAGLDSFDPSRIGLVIGGSNLQSREQVLMHQAYAARLPFMLPSHVYGFFDTDLCGLCTSSFAIRGFAYTVGGASASGALAVLHAADAVRSGRVDACIALGALQDLSFYECQGLRALGAMGARHFVSEPGRACRPFDRDHDGFIFGESSAALVICKQGAATSTMYGSIAGGAHIADGNRGPDPSLEGEVRAIRLALEQAGLRPEQIDYINAHGTGTPLGDDTEVAAYREAGIQHAWINATKSLIGHGLSAAGTIEVAAVLLQMRDGRLHATRNLDVPIDPTLKWVRGMPQKHTIRNALKLSFGFAGIDTAIVVRAPELS